MEITHHLPPLLAGTLLPPEFQKRSDNMATGHYTIIISEAVRVTERKDAQRAVEEGGRQATSAPSV